MRQYERHRLILEAIRKHEVVHIDDLIELTGASPSTVRRDVDSLQKSGEVIALRGGAVQLNERFSELPVATKALINQKQKTAIASFAARQVSDGDTIYLDSGTTALQMMQFLRGMRLHVVTSNTYVVNLVPDPKIKVTLLPGEYHADIGSVSGTLTERMLRDFYFDRAFIGGNGCSKEMGISTFNVREAAKKQIVQQNSHEDFVLIDSSKIGRITTCKALELSNCTVITDAPHELLDLVAKTHIAEAE